MTPDPTSLRNPPVSVACDPRHDVVNRYYTVLLREAKRRVDLERRSISVSATDLVHSVIVRAWPKLGQHLRTPKLYLFTAIERKLVDYYRKRNTQKRGGNRKRQSMDVALAEVPTQHTGWAELEMSDALAEFAKVDPQKALLVRHLINGFSLQEISTMLGISLSTAYDWKRIAVARLRSGNVNDADDPS